ncbi:MAG: acyl-CoA dehydrogenase family protein [Actinomycetota bacterium]|nr:acyl-CoA dehydrogenase family protein [Actinomycetota bacterium]
MTPLERLTPLLPLIAATGPESDLHRRPSSVVMQRLAKADLMRMVVPQEYRGEGASSSEFMTFVEAIARVHPSTAWTAMTCNEEAGIASAYLEPETMRRLFVDTPDLVIAGSGVPRGLARPAAGGWTVSGRWDFVSGADVADRMVLASQVADSKPLRLCFVLVPAHDVRIEDTWHTLGLRGTGSNDVVADELFVPDEWCGVVENFSRPRPDTPFYRLPSSLRFPFPKVGVACGVARAALDAFVAMASERRPLNHRSVLAERPSVQIAVAAAEATLSSARAWALEMAEELWAAAADSPEIDPKLHARCRLACSHAVAAGIDAIESVVTEAGASANRLWPEAMDFRPDPDFDRGPNLGQLLADARAVGGHFTVGSYQRTVAGRVLLGLPAGDPQF